ncbi:hypothetical protein BH09GEM1_BH09GEM1_11880 [soil metagenome]
MPKIRFKRKDHVSWHSEAGRVHHIAMYKGAALRKLRTWVVQQLPGAWRT